MTPTANGATSSKNATRRGVTEQAAVAAIDSGTRMLRLPTIRDRFDEIAPPQPNVSSCPTSDFSPSW